MTPYFTDEEKQWIKKEKFKWSVKDGAPDDIRDSINTKLSLIYQKENRSLAKSFTDILNEQTEESRTFTITKAEEDKRLVFGWANVAIRANGEQIEDLQGDMVEPEDLESAVYEYVLDFRDGGEEHIPSLRKKARMVESVIFTEEKLKAMGIPLGTVPLGWWIGFYVDDDEAWEKVKDGTYTMFSVEGKGVRHPVKKSESIEKFNPYHDRLGRFASAGAATTFTYAPGKSKAHDLAIEREKQRYAAGGGGNSSSTSGTEPNGSKKINMTNEEFSARRDSWEKTYEPYQRGQITKYEAGTLYREQKAGNVKCLKETTSMMYNETEKHARLARERYSQDSRFYDTVEDITNALLNKDYKAAQFKINDLENDMIRRSGRKSPYFKYKTQKSISYDIAKSFYDILKFNPYHDRLGRFASAGNAASFTYAPGKSKAHDMAIEREKQRYAAAGGGGGAQSSGSGGGNVFADEEPVQISSTYRTAGNNRYGRGYYTKDVYQAKPDGEGGISLSRAEPTNRERRNNGNTDYEYNLKNGVYPSSNSSGVNNSVGINWDNVKSVSGDTYNAQKFLKEKGFSWNSEKKRYEKGGTSSAKNGKLTISGNDFPDDLSGITVITGNTYKFKDRIKDAGFKWNPADKTWVKKGMLFEEITKGYTLEVMDDEEVAKSFYDILKFNPYHDRLGRFATGGGFMGPWSGPSDRRAVTFSANPDTKAGAMAIARESGNHETIGRAYGLNAYKPKEKPKVEKPKAEKPKTEKPKVEKPKEVETEFKAATTKKEAVAYAKEKLGIEKVSYGSKLDLETINHVNEQITKVYDRYPELKGSLNELKTTTKQGTYAYAQTLANGEMKLAIGTTIYGKGMGHVRELYQKDVQSGFHPKGTDASSVITHEMGHIYNYTKVRSSTGVADNATFENKMKYANDLNRRTTAKKWLEKAASSVGKSPSDFAKAISKYASRNAAEAFAEAFAEFNNSPNPRPECIALMKAAGILK